MKKLFVFVPAIIVVLFLLNSFVLKKKKSKDKIIENTKSATGFTLRDQWFIDPFAKALVAKVNNSRLENVVLKSADGGQTWQDISKGLPKNEQPVNFFAGEFGLYLHVNNAMYRSENNLKTPVWEKENVPDLQSASSRPSTSIVFNRSGVLAYNFDGLIYQKMPAAKTWLPVYTNFTKQSM